MFNNIPKNWEIKQLGDITEVVAGGTPSTQKAEYWDGDIPWITPKDLSNYTFKYIAKGERCITEEGLKGSSAKLMPKDTVLFTSRAPIGYVAIAQNEISTNQGFKNFICGEKILPDYLYYYLKNNKAYVESLAAGATFKEISATTTKKIKIPLPPTIEEQKEIVKILDTANDMVRLRQECIDHTNNLIPAIFQEMFGNIIENERKWKRVKIKDLGQVQTGNTPPRSNSEYYGNYIDWIKSDNIVAGKPYVTSSSERLSQQGYAHARIVPPNSLLVTCIAGSLNSIGNVALTDREVAFNQQINSITCFDDVDSYFLYGMMIVAKPYIQALTPRNMKNILNKNNFENIQLIKPPIDKQKQFSKLIKDIIEHKNKQEQEFENAKQLFDNLLHHAFTGELTRNAYGK